MPGHVGKAEHRQDVAEVREGHAGDSVRMALVKITDNALRRRDDGSSQDHHDQEG